MYPYPWIEEFVNRYPNSLFARIALDITPVYDPSRDAWLYPIMGTKYDPYTPRRPGYQPYVPPVEGTDTHTFTREEAVAIAAQQSALIEQWNLVLPPEKQHPVPVVPPLELTRTSIQDAPGLNLAPKTNQPEAMLGGLSLLGLFL